MMPLHCVLATACARKSLLDLFAQTAANGAPCARRCVHYMPAQILLQLTSNIAMQ